jgi:hypothetical protein
VSIKNLKSNLDSNLQSAAPALTVSLRKQAASRGWPDELTQSLSVVVKQGVFAVDYPAELKEKIEDLEYGTGMQAPASAIRSFQYQLEDFATQIYETHPEDMLEEVNL